MGVGIHKVNGKITFKAKWGFVLPKHRDTGPHNALHLQLYSKDRPCDRKMLAELNALTPRGRREKLDRQLGRGIIGLKHRLGMGVHWSSQLADELHKPVRGRFQKRSVFAKQADDTWTDDLIGMTYSRSNSGYKYL